MLDLTNYIQILHNLSCVHLSVIHPTLCPPMTRDPFHADKGAQRVCGIRDRGIHDQEVSETARELGLATAEESILQNELPHQEAPTEHHPQHPQSSLDESSSI